MRRLPETSIEAIISLARTYEIKLTYELASEIHTRLATYRYNCRKDLEVLKLNITGLIVDDLGLMRFTKLPIPLRVMSVIHFCEELIAQEETGLWCTFKKRLKAIM